MAVLLRHHWSFSVRTLGHSVSELFSSHLSHRSSLLTEAEAEAGAEAEAEASIQGGTQ